MTFGLENQKSNFCVTFLRNFYKLYYNVFHTKDLSSKELILNDPRSKIIAKKRYDTILKA